MKFPPYIRDLVDYIKKATKKPGEWETIRRALSTYKNLVYLDKKGWRFYAIRRSKDGGEVRSVMNWDFADWDLEDEEVAIVSNKIEEPECVKTKPVSTKKQSQSSTKKRPKD